MMEDAVVTLLTSRLDSIDRSIRDEKRESAESRRRVYQKLEDQERKFEMVIARLTELERVTSTMAPTIKELVALRMQVDAAGKLGNFLWGAGRHIIAAAVGLVAAWAWFSGFISNLLSGK